MKMKKAGYAVIAFTIIDIALCIGVYFYVKDKSDSSIFITGLLGVLGIAYTYLFSKSNHEIIEQNPKKIRRHNKWGYIVVLLFFFFIASLYLVLLSQERIMYITFFICSFCFIVTTLIFTIKSKKSFSNTEDSIVDPELLWRLVWNRLPTRFETKRDDVLNILIIYSKDGLEQVDKIKEKYVSKKLEIHFFDCDKKGEDKLCNAITTKQYLGVYLIYTDDIQQNKPWVQDLCDKWASNNKDMPIIYSNYTETESPLNYGIIDEKSDGILRLFQRTNILSESWKQQSSYFHKLLIGLFALLISIVIFALLHKKSEKVVLYGGGTVQNHIQGKLEGSNVIFVPCPSGEALGSINDNFFMTELKDNLIIMASIRAREKRFKSIDDKVVEVFLKDTEDTLYIRTNINDIYNKYKNGIKRTELIALLESYSNEKSKVSIYLTSSSSGTWEKYNEITDSLISKKIQLKPPYTKIGSFALSDSSIILTRSNYDPFESAKAGSIAYKIKIVSDEDSSKYLLGGLYLYIPLQQYNKNSSFKLNSNIKHILERIGIDVKEIENRKILPNQKIIVDSASPE